MIRYIHYIIILVVLTNDVSTDLPKYVHPHTMDEIGETNYVLLDKLDVCQSFDTKNHNFFVAIKTAAENRNQRNILRQTWLADVVEHHIPYIFVLGATNDEQLIREILVEDRTYNDLLIGKPVDNYYNLTLKGLFLLAWTETYCSDHWLLYVDDDSIVNIKKAIEFMGSVKNQTDRVIYCQLMRQAVIRNPNSKWFVPASIWPRRRYPTYCSGNGYLIPPTTLPLLRKTATNSSMQPKLWIEDAFITGIAAEAARIKLINAPFRCCMDGNTVLFNEVILLGQMGKQEQLIRAWKSLGRNLTLNTKTQPQISISMIDVSRFDRQGYRLIKRTWNNGRFFQSVIERSFSSLITCSVLFAIASLMIMGFLNSKKRLILIQIRPTAKSFRNLSRIYKTIIDLAKR